MITTIVKVTLAQYRVLEAGGTVGSHTYDPDHCFYVIDDGLVLPQESGQYVIKTDDDGETYYYDSINLTWDEIDNKPSTFPPSAHNHSTSDITSGVFNIARIPDIPLTKITGVSTIGTTTASTTPIVATVNSSSTNAQIPTALAVYNALSLAPGIATVTSSGSGQFVNSIAYNANTHELSYGLVGGSSNPLTSSIYVGHGDLTFINTVGRGGFRSTSTTATTAGYAHNGQFNWSNFGGVTNSWGFQITALDIPNDRYNQLRVWQNGLVYNTYKNSTGATTDVFSISPAGAITVIGDISYRGSKSTNSIIKFKNNTSDEYGNGIAIGGGGIVIVGAGESSDLSYGSAGDESLYLAADSDIHFYSNAQSGLASAQHMTFNTSGTLSVPGSISEGGTSLVDKYAAKSHTHILFPNRLVVEPEAAATNYNQGIRINKAADGWALIMLGGNTGTTTGTAAGVWMLARRGTAGNTTGAVGDLTIEHSGSQGNGLTLYANGNRPRWNNNEFAYTTDIKNAVLTIQQNGTTVNSFSANASSNVTANIITPQVFRYI